MTGRETVVVAIDLDDTLYPELAYARSAVRAAARLLESRLALTGIAEHAEQVLVERFPAPGSLQCALAELGVSCDEAAMGLAIEAMRAHVPTIDPFDDTMATLQRLRERALLALVSEGRSVTQWAKLAALGVTDHFDDVVITGELPPPAGKVTGAPYRALRSRHPAARRFFMIGDNPAKDGDAARREGFVPLLVRRPGHRYVHPAHDQAPVHATLAAAADELLRLLDVE